MDTTLSSAAALKIRELTLGYCISQAIASAARLGIADLLRDGPRGASELARLTKSDEPSLQRLLRALAAQGIFAEQEDGTFVLTPAAEFLRADHPESLRDWSVAMAGELYRGWAEFDHSIRFGEPAFPRVFGCQIFEYFSKHPEVAADFDRAMVSYGAGLSASLAESYDFAGVAKIVDVGGGYGRILAGVLKRYPSIRGVVFDLSHVEAGARATFASNALSGRCEFIAGSFFDTVPQGGDLYFLSQVIHDWNDEKSLQILSNCRRALKPSGKLVVMDIVMSNERNFPDRFGRILDLHMLAVSDGGRERTVGEFRSLLERSGFQLARVIPTRVPASLIEAVPV